MHLFKLHFVGEEELSLYRTEFTCGSSQFCAVRGKTSGAFSGQGSFHWSSAVRAMCILAIKTALAARGFACDPIIVGEKGSYAASLDYAISKETTWLIDMFGRSVTGTPNLRTTFRRTNSGRKRSGPVAVSFSRSFLEPGAIHVRRDSKDIESVQCLTGLLERLAPSEEMAVAQGLV